MTSQLPRLTVVGVVLGGAGAAVVGGVVRGVVAGVVAGVVGRVVVIVRRAGEVVAVGRAGWVTGSGAAVVVVGLGAAVVGDTVDVVADGTGLVERDGVAEWARALTAIDVVSTATV
jgi:hypothetical protein